MLDITLPSLPGGAALVLRWLAAPGISLLAGAPLLIVRTAIAEVALPAPAAGELAQILAAAGAMVEAGQPLARLRPAGRPARPASSRTTPLARRIAAAHGISLADLAGSGPDGRVVAADVRQIVGAKHSPADVRRASEIAVANASPLQSAMLEFDAGAALARVGAGLSAAVAACAAQLLPGHRALNARWGDDGILLHRRLHLAVAAPAPAGLRWALVRDAGDLTLGEVAQALLVTAHPAALAEASFALVSLADGAVWHSAPPPLAGRVAALGLGAPRSLPVAYGEAIAVRPVAALTLCYDARAIDHAQAVAFLRDLRAALERL